MIDIILEYSMSPAIHAALQNLSERAKRAVSRRSPPNLVTALPCQRELEFTAEMASGGLIVPVIIGPEADLRARWDAISRSRVYLVDAPDSVTAAALAADHVRNQRADIMLCGGLSTDELTNVITATGGGFISHVAAVALPKRDHLLMISDGGWILQPNLRETVGIIHNCTNVLKAIGIQEPKIAVLSAVEDIDPRISRTLEAAAISQMSRRGLFDPAVVDGPIRFDHAIAHPAGHAPPFASPVVGEADAVVAGSMEEANILIKTLVYMGDAQFGGLLVGGAVPVIWPAWNSPGKSPLLSLVLAILVWHASREED
jgi:phosphate acetyltransferase